MSNEARLLRTLMKMGRASKGWTQRRLAAALGVSTNFVSLLETGKRDPSWSTVVRLVNCLNLEPIVLALQLKEQIMHPSTEAVFQFFSFAHLPEKLQEVSKPFHDLAKEVGERADGPETTVALRKLLEAKDAAVRAATL